MAKNLKWLIHLFLLIILLHSSKSFAINEIKNISIAINDTLTFTYSQHAITFKGEKYLPFYFDRPSIQTDIKLWVDHDADIKKIELLPSSDYKQIDSIIYLNNEYYTFRVKFIDLINSSNLTFRFKIYSFNTYRIEEIRLFPYTSTALSHYIADNELFIGEEKVFEIFSNFPENLRLPFEWVSSTDFDYRLQYINKQLRLHIVPKSLGKKLFSFSLNTYKPNLLEGKVPTYTTPTINILFTVKSGRLAFLNLDRKEFTFDETVRREGIEVQIDNHRALLLKKTYRIEDQENPGGALIGEIYTRQNLNNDKVLCRLRLYNLHRPTDGYLYIKDGDEAKFITNFGISPKTSIHRISILRNGLDWKETNTVYPGETVNIRLEGVGMQKANFKFEEIETVFQDSIVKTDFAVEFRIKIPENISKKKVFIYNYGENTGSFLSVKEFQTPRNFDFLFINYGEGSKSVEAFTGPELYTKTLKDIVISFDPDKIDSSGKFYGKQYIEVTAKITGSRGELVELVKLPTLVVCPGDRSIRHGYYDLRDCARDNIHLNAFLDRKTYDFDDWTKIRLTFSHVKDKYDGTGLDKSVDIILQRKIKFDIDVSFPSLLTKIVKEEGWQNGLGVSMAMIAQFSFYEKDKIARLMPYKIGFGFLALNAFNFSDNNNTRDLGLVILGSVYPTRRDSKLSFPLYLGGGYLLNKSSWFWVFGPGIRVSF